MRDWRRLTVGDRVVAFEVGPERDQLPGTLVPVPVEHRDDSGSHATTTRGAFPKAWVRFDATAERGSRVVPWPVSHLEPVDVGRHQVLTAVQRTPRLRQDPQHSG